ncbi:O-methylsterigmatocystin oxidoreductase [Rhizoctonia solani]|uniref:O-methylsterigmatocystin oxidoreductase n=1 Tax=Rhizoctonia solani TaxID=456999 RepID=A0A0K6GD64_9AGAM|nr:O-methylsterigmatocystin oxidoreductase [Rhizoctonia solani]
MNVLDDAKTYRGWGLELGSDIISVTVPGQVIIILNSREAVDELLFKRSLIYSDRPQVPMLSSDNLTGWGNYTAVLAYGEKWKFHRKLMHETLQRSASEERWPMIQKESRLALQRILANPSEFSQELRHMAGSTLLMAVYGYEVTSPDNSLFKTVKIASDGFIQAAVAPNFLVNTFPWLDYVPEWFPGATWKAKANLWRTQKDRMLHVPYNWTKNKMSTGTEVPSMVSTWLKKYVHQQSTAPVAELEERIKWIAGGLFAAGSDTSVSVLRTFIIAMAMHPDVQAKAQAEIDSIIGLRLPELSDQCSLPYARCVIKEVIRWRIPAPLALPHSCIQDDTYKGYHIPKGAIVIGNIWAISNDSEVYPEPDRFNPDRFLDLSVPEAPAFGFGRRICPGLHHAEAVVTITALGLLAMFNIRPGKDENGRPVPPKADTTVNEVLRQVLPFKCKISPRSEKHEQMVREWVG